MLTAKDVKNITFSKQVNGYRREEVDVFLDKVESDYENYERTVSDMAAKIRELESQIEDSKNSEDSIGSVLISAQKLADSIVAKAKEKSAAIIEEAKINLENFKAHEKELSGAFDKKAEERKQSAREALNKIIEEAKINRDKVSEETKKAVQKQTELFNRLKLETVAFKSDLIEKYKHHLELLSKIPDSVPSSPEDIAAAVDLNIDDLSNKEEFIKNLDIKKPEIPANENPGENTYKQETEETTDNQSGFKVNLFKEDD